MPVYHQMGHHSENLLHAPELAAYRGAILSPVNYQRSDVVTQIEEARERGHFETLFDPQLYFPNTDRGFLREWSYFPSDVDTADLASQIWWNRTIDALVETCRTLNPSAVCSPAVVPRVYSDDYFARSVEVGTRLSESLRGTEIRPIQTGLVGLADVSTPGRSLAIASVLSATPCDQLYLVFIGDTDPRRELNDPEALKGAMRLVSALQQADMSVLVGFCSSDIVLWKAAGAASCATGKFFNLRRFTSSRFEEPSQGGGQLPYWLEESLLAFLRESDVLRVRDRNMLSEASVHNPFGQQVLRQFSDQPGSAWVALGWRQFMYWFADIESRIDAGTIDVRALLRAAEVSWTALEDADVLMEEIRNNGAWLRAWRRALAEYASH